MDGRPLVKEKPLSLISFHKNIYRNKDCPTIYVIGFVEFGCETFFPLYVLPNIIKENPNHRIVFVGWKGREYFYKHLVDEYWELNDEYMWLRNYARAMNHESCNLKKVENYLSKIGIVINSDLVGNNLIEFMCLDCNYKSGSARHVRGCPSCGSGNLRQSLLSQQTYFRDNLHYLPNISQEKIDWIKSIIPKNAVAIFARKRDAYGRNLDAVFYLKLIAHLKKLGYNPIWVGEKQSSLKCPSKDILDFSEMKESDDLENTIATISCCEFTIQFWTASTRLSMLANTKFFLVECPDQIYGNGQEGIRLRIFNTHKTPHKLFLCNYNNFIENLDLTFSHIENAIHDFVEGNFEDNIDMIENKKFLEGLKIKNAFR